MGRRKSRRTLTQGKKSRESVAALSPVSRDREAASALCSAQGSLSFTDMRRRALTLVDVIADSHKAGPLHLHRAGVAVVFSFWYWSCVLPMISSWGTARWSTEVRMGVTQANVGGAGAEVRWAFAVLGTLAYLFIVFFGVRFMEKRPPVQNRIFEWMIVYNAMQALLNLRLVIALLYEVYQLGYRSPWGNALDPSEKGHKLGMLIWLQYHCRQLDLLDTVFMILRKKFQRISFVHVYLRLLNMWGWFIACRFACGGDTYFPAIVNASCQVLVYLYYTLHLLRPNSLPFFRRARVAEMQVLQFMICAAHAVFVLAYGDIPRSVVAFNLFVMANALAFYVDFDSGHPRLGPKNTSEPNHEGFGKERITVCFDSCGWLYCYHFGVAKWIEEHMLPDNLTAAEAESERYPAGLAFSGSSGGSLVAGALGSGIKISDLFEYVLGKRPECKSNPYNLFPALEDAMTKFLPNNAARSLSGRVRVLLTRVSTKPPFVSGEIVDQYRDRDEVWDSLRASCHVPGLWFRPWKMNGRCYFDGLVWSSFFVPWASEDSHTIRVSAVSRPLVEISAPIQPFWWAFFPPSLDALRGLYWIGYRDAARWFSEKPVGQDNLCRCRRATSGPAPVHDEAEDSALARLISSQMVKYQTAQKLIINQPQKQATVDPVTGRSIEELIECHKQAVEWNLRIVYMGMVIVVVALLAAAFY